MSDAALVRIQEAEKELQQLDTVYKELAADASLTAASMAPPPIGTAADVVSIGRSLWKGDWGGALLDVVGIIPIIGDGIKGISKGSKIAAKMKDVKIALDTARAKLTRRRLEKLRVDTDEAIKSCSKEKCPKIDNADTMPSGKVGSHRQPKPKSNGTTSIKGAKSTFSNDIPEHTYRGDSRRPDEIFDKGFEPRAKGSDASLEDYARNNSPSDYVGTSKDFEEAKDFATNYGDRDGYVYTVKPDKGIDVNKELGNKSPFPNEQEVAIPGGIKPENIKGATPVNKNGSLDNSTILNQNHYKKPNE